MVIRTGQDTCKIEYQRPVFLESHHFHKRFFRQVLLRKKVVSPGKGNRYRFYTRNSVLITAAHHKVNFLGVIPLFLKLRVGRLQHRIGAVCKRWPLDKFQLNGGAVRHAQGNGSFPAVFQGRISFDIDAQQQIAVLHLACKIDIFYPRRQVGFGCHLRGLYALDGDYFRVIIVKHRQRVVICPVVNGFVLLLLAGREKRHQDSGKKDKIYMFHNCDFFITKHISKTPCQIIEGVPGRKLNPKR